MYNNIRTLKEQIILNNMLEEIDILHYNWEVCYPEDDIRYICEKTKYLPNEISHDGTYHWLEMTWECNDVILTIALYNTEKTGLFSAYFNKTTFDNLTFDNLTKDTVVKMVNELYYHDNENDLIDAMSKFGTKII